MSNFIRLRIYLAHHGKPNDQLSNSVSEGTYWISEIVPQNWTFEAIEQEGRLACKWLP